MFDNDFYPTPETLIDHMLETIDKNRVNTILEPSAGRGDIIEHIKERDYKYDWQNVNLDAIELDPELSMILTGKGHKPIFNDFLQFNTFQCYDLIIMNPPFSDGDKHLLHAIKMQLEGGQVVCLLNAETIKNPYTNVRKELATLIEKYDGTIEYIADAFSTADRKTDVEIALVYLDIPQVKPTSDILKNLIEAQKLADDTDSQTHKVVEGDYIYGAVRRFEVEISAGLKLISEYEALKPLLSRTFKSEGYDHPILELTVDRDSYKDLRNTLIEQTRKKYWEQLFQSSEFSRLFTSKTQGDYMKRIHDLARYEFNVSNIKQMQIEISQAMLGSLDDAIVKLFDEFSSQYWDEQSKNIHYYNGWKTNKAYIINKKVITRIYSFDSYDGQFSPYKAAEKMSDIHKVFSYLDGALSSHDITGDVLDVYHNCKTTIRGVEFPYCRVDFFKKGTAHITFKNDRLLKKFNLIGSQRKGWLPPAYGKAAYDDLPKEYQDIVDSFEGKESYAETVANQEFYLTQAQPTLSLGAGVADEAIAA